MDTAATCCRLGNPQILAAIGQMAAKREKLWLTTEEAAKMAGFSLPFITAIIDSKTYTGIECNNAKSKLEHALTVIMPFGAQHGDAAKALGIAEPRLAKNKKLHAWLAVGVPYAMRSINGGPWRVEMSVPVDHRNIERLCEFMVKGLAYHHWKVALGPDHFVRASCINEAGRQRFDPFFAGAGVKVQQDFGDGVFAYEGVQSQDCSELTLWKMSIYEAEVGGDKRQPGDRSSTVYGISVPKTWRTANMLMEILGPAG